MVYTYEDGPFVSPGWGFREFGRRLYSGMKYFSTPWLSYILRAATAGHLSRPGNLILFVCVADCLFLMFFFLTSSSCHRSAPPLFLSQLMPFPMDKLTHATTLVEAYTSEALIKRHCLVSAELLNCLCSGVIAC